ncbi:hypothetical protein SLE2022_127540 [Rubroshorea leprosula]
MPYVASIHVARARCSNCSTVRRLLSRRRQVHVFVFWRSTPVVVVPMRGRKVVLFKISVCGVRGRECKLIPLVEAVTVWKERSNSVNCSRVRKVEMALATHKKHLLFSWHWFGSGKDVEDGGGIAQKTPGFCASKEVCGLWVSPVCEKPPAAVSHSESMALERKSNQLSVRKSRKN